MDDNPYQSPPIPADPVDTTYRLFDCSGCLAAGLMCVLVAAVLVAIVGLMLR